jgi:hypothetical protein
MAEPETPDEHTVCVAVPVDLLRDLLEIAERGGPFPGEDGDCLDEARALLLWETD